jgi:3-methyl-2-oxobutanoate hydroxymethyltransferase
MTNHQRLTVADLRAAKGRRQFTDVYVSSEEEAAAAVAGGVDMVTIQDTQMSASMRAAAGDAFVIVGLDYGKVVTTDDYLRAAFAAINIGADACWSAASLHTIERMAAEGIPVVGHVGLIPPRRTWTGGFKAVGKTAESAMSVWRQTQQLAGAGAFAAEIEVVPEPVASAISARTSLFMISMGSGPYCDGQYLFSSDVLGTNRGHVPRHAKQYADLATELDRLQQLRVAAYAAFADDVANGGFPDSGRLVGIDADELAAFTELLDE